MISSSIAVVAITALLLLLWRSPRYALFALAPLALGALLTAAATVALGLPLNFANVIVLPLVLGGSDTSEYATEQEVVFPPGLVLVYQGAEMKPVGSKTVEVHFYHAMLPPKVEPQLTMTAPMPSQGGSPVVE